MIDRILREDYKANNTRRYNQIAREYNDEETNNVRE